MRIHSTLEIFLYTHPLFSPPLSLPLSLTDYTSSNGWHPVGGHIPAIFSNTLYPTSVVLWGIGSNPSVPSLPERAGSGRFLRQHRGWKPTERKADPAQRFKRRVSLLSQQLVNNRHSVDWVGPFVSVSGKGVPF